MKPAALLLDLDDTVLCYGAVANACWEAACVAHAPRLAAVDPARLAAALRESRRWFWSDPERHRQGRLDPARARRQVALAAFSSLGLDAPEVAVDLADEFSRTREERVEPFPGALAALRTWRGQGIRLALVTNGSAALQRAKIDRFGLLPLFDAIVIEGELGVGKPEPEPFLRALAALGAAPGEAWMVGDDLDFDIRPAVRLGLYGVWIAPSAGPGAAGAGGPDRVAGSLGELAATLEREWR
jgi:putative hydrolase of the HAD superfamily